MYFKEDFIKSILFKKICFICNNCDKNHRIWYKIAFIIHSNIIQYVFVGLKPDLFTDIWQRRYWEHTIINKEDLYKHIDYIHYNSMKHYGIIPKNWEFSSFYRFVEKGYYEKDWCNFEDIHKINELDLE